jgi:hypothetical protein
LINGDISNETPPRIVVTIDVIVQSEVEESKRLFGSKSFVRKITELNRPELSRLWNASFTYGLAVELAAFEEAFWTQEAVDKLMARLDNRGGNPFNYAELYPSFRELVEDLPYRTNLKAVIDTPGQVARYGSWGLDLANL